MTPKQSSGLIVAFALAFGLIALFQGDYDRAIVILGSLVAGYIGGESVWRKEEEMP